MQGISPQITGAYIARPRVLHPERLRKWFNHESVTGIGVIFGAVSGGLASRDFDVESAYDHDFGCQTFFAS